MYRPITSRTTFRALQTRSITTSFPRLSVNPTSKPDASNPPGVRKPVEPSDPAFKSQQDAHVREKDSGSADKQNDVPESAARATGETVGSGVTGDAGMQKGPNKGDAENLKKSQEVGKDVGGTETPRSG